MIISTAEKASDSWTEEADDDGEIGSRDEEGPRPTKFKLSLLSEFILESSLVRYFVCNGTPLIELKFGKEAGVEVVIGVVVVGIALEGFTP